MRRMFMRGRRGRGKATELNFVVESDCQIAEIDVQPQFSMHRAFELHCLSFAVASIRPPIHGSFNTFCSDAIRNLIVNDH